MEESKTASFGGRLAAGQTTKNDGRPHSWGLDAAIYVGLLVATLAVYAQVARFDFVDYDDSVYVFNNPNVTAGLTLASMKYALRAVVAGNRMPLTLLSHIIDCQLFGLHSGMHHLTNVGFHVLSTWFLFATLRRATGERWPSAFVAMVFALHPLHVGSVAWVAERKDVLSAFLFFLALYVYVRYSERPGPGLYLLVCGIFGLGLLAKPMLVTFPFVLLLFDVWPLGRFEWPRMLGEKIPLLAMSAGASWITYRVQNAVGSVKAIPIAMRIENALISYIIYIRETLWPTRLAVYYPYPQSIPAWQAAGALALLVGVSVLVILVWRTRPYAAAGWFWYLGTLVPVIGFVHVGEQGHADRYTYIPMAGLGILVAWGGAEAARKWPGFKPAIAAAATVSGVVWLTLAWQETAYWQNSETLFRRAIEVTDANWQIQSYMGEYLVKIAERRAEAIPYFEEALRIRPDLPNVSNNLGASLLGLERYGDAIPHFEDVLRANPNSAAAHYNLAVCLMHTGRYEAAAANFQAVVRIEPENAGGHLKLGETLMKIPGRELDAIGQFEAVLSLQPDDAESHRRLGELLASQGRTSEAISHLEAAQRGQPDPETERALDRLKAGRR